MNALPWPTSISDPNEQPWVLITGGAQRLGRCLCTAFAESGWRVLIHHRHSAKAAQALARELQACGHASATVAGELDSPAAVDALFDAAWQAAGGALHTIVCNASTFEPDTGRDLDPALLQRQLQVNLAAPLQLGQRLHAAWAAWAAAPNSGAPRPGLVHLLDQKVYNLNPDYFSYTVSKLALERAVALQAQALAPLLRVNAVAPGLMFVSGPQSEANFARARTVNLLQQAIAPTDVARAAVFLAGTASCCGATLTVDCGQHLVPLGRDVMFALDHLHPAVLPQSAV